jgi:transposase
MRPVGAGEHVARYELSDAEWKIIAPLLRDKSRGLNRVDDLRVLNGIFWRLRFGAPWAGNPPRCSPYMMYCNRFARWQKAGVWVTSESCAKG